MDEPSLRERKKRETRQRISDVATSLFATRGFDNVTVAEVAEAANVSKMTVFNYFPRKEELFFDRNEEVTELLHAAIRDRAPGVSVVNALRALMLRLTEQRHPLSGLREGVNRFWQVVADSPTLRAHIRELVEQLDNELATEFAAVAKAEPGDPMPALAAGLVVATMRTLYQHAMRGLMTGERADDLYPAQVALVNRAFDMLEAAIGDQLG